MGGRLAGLAVILTVATAALAAGTAGAATPHMDRVEAAMRKVAPGLEGVAYKRTRHNRFVGYNGRPASWLLQTPDCWGQPACGNPVGIRRFLRTLEADTAKARVLVDLTTMVPLPTGKFRAAIVRGLRRAYASGRRPTIRVHGGCDPPCEVEPGTSPAQAYADALAAAIGRNARVIVSVSRFPPLVTPATLPSLSWNHSKTIAVDGRVALVGGHNLWSADYIQRYPAAPVTNPVHDVTFRVEGPLTVAIHTWANALWRHACSAAGSTGAGSANGASVAYSPRTPPSCPRSIRPPRAPRSGNVDVLGLGRFALLGVPDPGPQPRLPDGPDDPAPCPTGLPYWSATGESPDWTNDRSLFPTYDPRNPAETGLRTLIASARSSVFIAQQDLHGICEPPQPGIAPQFDRRLLDVLARRLLARGRRPHRDLDARRSNQRVGVLLEHDVAERDRECGPRPHAGARSEHGARAASLRAALPAGGRPLQQLARLAARSGPVQQDRQSQQAGHGRQLRHLGRLAQPVSLLARRFQPADRGQAGRANLQAQLRRPALALLGAAWAASRQGLRSYRPARACIKTERHPPR